MKRRTTSALVAILLMVSHVAQAVVAAAMPCAEDFAGSATFLDAACAHDDAKQAVGPWSGHEVPDYCAFCASGMCRLAQVPAMVTRFSAAPYAPPDSLRFVEPAVTHFASPLFEYLRPPD